LGFFGDDIGGGVAVEIPYNMRGQGEGKPLSAKGVSVKGPRNEKIVWGKKPITQKGNREIKETLRKGRKIIVTTREEKRRKDVAGKAREGSRRNLCLARRERKS